MNASKSASKNGNRPRAYRSAQEAELAYENGLVKLHDYAEYRRPGHEHFLTTVGRIIFNDRVERAIAEALGEEYDPESYEFINRSLKKGDVNQIVSDLVENYGAVLEEILRVKPAAAKGRYIKSVTMASTMGPGIHIDSSRTRDLLEETAAG